MAGFSGAPDNLIGSQLLTSLSNEGKIKLIKLSQGHDSVRGLLDYFVINEFSQLVVTASLDARIEKSELQKNLAGEFFFDQNRMYEEHIGQIKQFIAAI